MDFWLAISVVASLLAVATIAGLILTKREGRVKSRSSSDGHREPWAGVSRPGFALGEQATLLQFSTEFCAKCPGTRRLLGSVANETEGVKFQEIDLTNDIETARRDGILSTPTTWILDSAGVVRYRATGLPRRDEITAALAELRRLETELTAARI